MTSLTQRINGASAPLFRKTSSEASDAESPAATAGRNAFVRQTFVREPARGAGQTEDIDMGFGRGVLLWLIGVPIPIIVLIALLWHH
jgi:hypothetical protein